MKSVDFLEVNDASFAYGKERVFAEISFELNRGEVLCLLGPNGSGKTTLIDCLLGLKRLDQGDIRLLGENINRLKPDQMAKKIAYVPQIHENSFPYKVIELILMGRAAYTSLFSSPQANDLNIAEEALKLVDMYEYKERICTQLSGGESKMIMIARALAQDTPIIILDEPTAHLDLKNEIKILETIEKLVKESNVSVIMATHNPNHAFYFDNNGIKTSILLLNNGNSTLLGSPDEILSVSNIESVYNVSSKILTYIDHEKHKPVNYIIPLNSLN